MKRVATVVVLLALLGLSACGGDDDASAPAPPAWAKVAPEQIAEAKKHGVPVAFENELGMRFVLIPAGTFMMGSPEDEEGREEYEGPQREVRISPFYMAATEVTIAQYRSVDADHDQSWGDVALYGEDRPVIRVTRDDATAFARWLSGRSGVVEYRLPSEAEWEYACRAGTGSTYSFGGKMTPDLAAIRSGPGRSSGDFVGSTGLNPAGIYLGGPRSVGSFPPNTWGLHDMHGNVDEWCQDPWHRSYDDAPVDGSAWLNKGFVDGVARGGSWMGPAREARSASRYRACPWYPYGNVGFRLVSPLPERSN